MPPPSPWLLATEEEVASAELLFCRGAWKPICNSFPVHCSQIYSLPIFPSHPRLQPIDAGFLLEPFFMQLASTALVPCTGRGKKAGSRPEVQWWIAASDSACQPGTVCSLDDFFFFSYEQSELTCVYDTPLFGWAGFFKVQQRWQVRRWGLGSQQHQQKALLSFLIGQNNSS